MNNKLGLVGIPFYGGQPKRGVENGPDALRTAGLIKAIEALGWHVVHDADVGIVPRNESTIKKLKDPHWVGAVCKDIHTKIYDMMKEGDFCLTVGGDHSVATGTISAILRHNPEVYVVWVDAHADINTPDTSDSGNLHGMPVAFLSKIAGAVEGFEWLENTPTLRLDRLLYVGLRDVDEGEVKFLKDHGIKSYWNTDVAKRGIAAITEEILEVTKGLPIHISFDIDALDPIYAPATGTPVQEGITLEDGVYLCEHLGKTGKVISMDMVEVNPSLSDEAGAQTTAASALQLIKTVLTSTRK